MRFGRRAALIIVFCTGLGPWAVGCSSGISTNAKGAADGSISGIAYPFQGRIASNTLELQNLFFKSAYAEACATAVTASIYAIDASGQKGETPLLTTTLTNNDGSYTFAGAKATGVTVTDQQTVSYIVEITGCGLTFSRPLTDYLKQNVTMASALISFVMNTNETLKTLQQVERKNLEEFMDALNGTDMTSVYYTVVTDPTLGQKFVTLFGSPISILQAAAPQLLLSALPTSLQEGSGATFSASAAHWDPDYDIVYLWKKDGVVVSHNANYTYTPSANSQGMHTISLYIGQDDGSGSPDTSQPYISKSLAVTVADTFLATPPTLTLITPVSSPFNTRSLTLGMATGAGLANCTSFSALAITENSLTPPTNTNDYTITCTQAGTQNVNFTLSSSGDGTKTLYLWAIDSSGSIGAVPSTLSVVLDTQGPAAPSITTPASSLSSNSNSQTISGACATDATQVQILVGGIVDSTVPCSDQAFTGSVNQTEDAAYAITAKAIDGPGNIGNASTAITWTRDTTAPAVPSITTPSGNLANNSSSITISGTCASDATQVQILVGASLESTVNCTSGNFSGSVSRSDDGTYVITAKAKDSTANTSSASTSITWTRDTIGPSAPVITTPASNLANTLDSTTVSGTCPADAAQVQIIIGGTVDSTVNCTSSAFSGTVSRNSDAAYTITTKAVDAVGNLSAASTAVNWMRDTVPPTLSGISFTSGGPTFPTAAFGLDISASDGAGSGITQYCFSEVGGACPASNWTGYSNGNNRTVYSTFVNGAHTMYIWVKDSAGNVSSNTSIAYELSLGTAPVISSIQVTNTATPSNPPTPAETTFSAGQTMYVTWTGSAAAGTISSPFSLAYSTDAATWTTLSSNFGALANGATIIDASTAAFNSPYGTSQKFFIRLGVIDQLGQQSFRTSGALNANQWRYLGGSSESGLGGSAFAARLAGGWGGRGNHSLAYDPNTRRIYFLDGKLNKLTYIDPATGRWMNTGVSVSMGNILTGMAIDTTRNVLYFSTSVNAAIYKISLSDFATSTFYTKPDIYNCGLQVDTAGSLYSCNTVYNIIKIPVDGSGNAGTPVPIAGTGVNGSPVAGALATASPINMNYGSMALSRNGELYFKQYGTTNIWRIKSSDGRLAQVVNEGLVGHGNIATGRTGDEILAVGGGGSTLLAVNGLTGAKTTLAGTGSMGTQADGADALSTAIQIAEGIVTTPEGQIYFVDGVDFGVAPYIRIRTIDSTNKIRTVAGTEPSHGDGVSVVSARFPSAFYSIRNLYDGMIYLLEANLIRRIDLTTTPPTISKWTGNGVTAAPNGALASTSMMGMTGMGFTSITDAVLFPLSSIYTYWYEPVGGFTSTTGALNASDQTNPLSPCDGALLSNCRRYSANRAPVDHDGNGNLYFIEGQTGAPPFRIYKVASDKTMTQLMGSNTLGWSPDCSVEGCAKTLSINRSGYNLPGIAAWDPVGSRVLFLDNDGTNTVLRAVTTTSQLTTIGTFTGGIESPGVYDRSRYYYYAKNVALISRMDVTNGTITDLGFPFANWLPYTSFLNGFMTSDGGNFVLFSEGVFYEYVP